MTHGRKPRKPRTINANAFGTALCKATTLTPAERASTIAPARECARYLREGVASDDQHTVLYTCLQVAQGIEHSGIVRGLHEHITSALQAMDTIRARATASGAWRPTALYHYELDAIREAVDLHEFQLRHISAGELHRIVARLIAHTTSTGGVAQQRTHQSLGLAAA